MGLIRQALKGILYQMFGCVVVIGVLFLTVFISVS